MTDLNIETILVDFLREHCLPQKTEITLGIKDDLIETGTIDSAGLIHFIGFIESRFGIDIPDEDLVPEKYTTVASITAYVRQRLEEASYAD